ncbi:chaperone modulatory protein CbpM [Pseudomonas sp. LS44]|uniref:chaperone modulator CbpM n=1 Tax=Pseudomonas sp. LS44 TaxID=1357074 RepID=UPI00215AABEA|nr:chaperone modulator CbpM [Pseudomonas sp. LS44]UVE17254.1 chaperone modulatory protein CbpM [Pseudomonas sp. LS44]
MASRLIIQFNLQEFCQCAELSTDYVYEIVEHGIVEPRGRLPEEWLFDAAALAIAKRAARMRRDLDIEWAGIALALNLLDELEQLRAENRRLRQRLDRFQLE